MLSKIIRNFIAKRVAGRTDDGIMITLSDPRKVDFQAAMLEDLLMRNGIDPRAITSEAQLKIILNQIEAASKQTTSGIRNTTSAKVFDMEGKEIPKGSKIMGGKEVPGTSDRDRVRNEMKNKYGFTDERLDEIENTPVDEEMADRLIAETDLPPPGSRGGKEDIAAPVQSQEETVKNMVEAEIKAKLEKQNKSAIENILKRKNREDVYGLDDYNTTNMSEIKKEIIRTETKLGNLNPNSPDFRERAKPLIDKITALQKKLREDKADGGRIGYKDGPKFDVQASGTKSGKQQIKNAPKGITIDKETFNAILKADIPLSEKIDFLASYEYGKGRDRIEKDGQELFLGEGGFKNRNIGLGFNKQGEGIGGTLMYNLETGKPQVTLKFKKSFADGGRIGLKFGTGKRFLQKVFGKQGLEDMKDRDPEMYVGLLEVVDMYRKRDKEGLKMYLQKFLPHMDDAQIEAFIRGSDGSEGLVGELIRLGSGRDYAGKIEMMKRAQEMRKLDDLEVTDEMIRKPNADGGIMRLGLKDGMSSAQLKKLRERLLKHNDQPLTKDTSILKDLIEALDGEGPSSNYNVKEDLPKEVSARDGGIMRLGLKEGSGMSRRTFLKLLGGFASIPIVGKILKPLKVGKTVTKVPIIKTDNVPGKPEWFDQLVNKVILEGEDVTKKLATVEREIVHTKKINNTDEVTVYQDLNTNSVRVEYKSPDNMMEEPVDLSYKKTPPDEGNPKGDVDFEVTESGFVGRADGPDDYFIDAEEVGGQSIKDLDSDVSALKEYATGEKPTMKEILQKMKRKEKVKKLNEGDLDAQSQYITDRQGDAYDYDDYASGGIARMLGE